MMAAKTDVPEELRRVPLFNGLDRKELACSPSWSRSSAIAAGTTIVEAGSSPATGFT